MNPGRNEICPCGSKQKYKKCCGFHSIDIKTAIKTTDKSILDGHTLKVSQRRAFCSTMVLTSGKLRLKANSISPGPSLPLMKTDEIIRKSLNYQTEPIENLWLTYTKHPTDQLIELIANRLGNGLVIEKLYELVAKNTSNTKYIFHLTSVLLNDDRHLESGYFCRILVDLEPNPNNWYLCGIIASYRNDLATLNYIIKQFASAEPGPFSNRVIIIRTAALYCARILEEARKCCYTMLKGFSHDPFCIELASYICIESQDTKLAQEIALSSAIENAFKPSSRLFIKLEALNRIALVSILANRSYHA